MICAMQGVGFRSFSSASTSVLSVPDPRQTKAKWQINCPLQLRQVLRVPEVFWSSRPFKDSHVNPQQRKNICLCPMPEILRRHMITHSGEKVHNCKECGETCGRAGNLKKHMLIHNGQRPHKCTQYDYASSRADDLRDHIKIHSLQKPKQCKWCEYSTIQSSSLTKHILTHSQWREATSL